MNKTKRVAWRKHRIKEKKAHEKRRVQQKSAGTAATAATSTARR